MLLLEAMIGSDSGSENPKGVQNSKDNDEMMRNLRISRWLRNDGWTQSGVDGPRNQNATREDFLRGYFTAHYGTDSSELQRLQKRSDYKSRPYSDYYASNELAHVDGLEEVLDHLLQTAYSGDIQNAPKSIQVLYREVIDAKIKAAAIREQFEASADYDFDNPEEIK